MLKAGIFLDMENLNRCGGYAIRFRQIKALVEAQQAVVVRANAYMAVDRERENMDVEYRQKRETYRNRARREGYHLILKEVRRYRNPDGETIVKADADLRTGDRRPVAGGQFGLRAVGHAVMAISCAWCAPCKTGASGSICCLLCTPAPICAKR